MPHYKTWGADDFYFSVRGRGAQRLFSQAARQGIPLRGIHCTRDGFAAQAYGRDRARLEALAARGGWQLAVTRRRGPGRLAERLLRRPGLAAGAALFLFLVRLLGGFVWAMDFAGLDSGQQQRLRAQLAQNGILEGSWLPQDKLARAQADLSLHNDQFGWLSLNFTGGCLFVESTPLERQPVQKADTAIALYARTDAEILRVEVDSGFAAVTPGQYVRKGQLLAADIRLDRDGAPITQSAGGRIWARAERNYTAEQPLQAEAAIPAAQGHERKTLYLFGRAIPLREPPAERSETKAVCHAQWMPVRVGRIALPACLYCAQIWPREAVTCQYSAQQAEDLARRACRLQLEAEFPGAVVEQQEADITHTGEKVVCTVHYRFRADIAQPSPSMGEALPQN